MSRLRFGLHRSVFVLLLLAVTHLPALSSTLQNNIALASLGATAYDNGHWIETSNGFPYHAGRAIDDDNTGSSFWAGLGYLPQEQIWILFDKRYQIHTIYIDELDPTNQQPNDHNSDYAYLSSALLEYQFDGQWYALTTIAKTTPDFAISFAPIEADGVRLSVYSSIVPPTWANQAAVVYSLEVAAVPELSSAALLAIGLSLLTGLRVLRRR